RRRIGHFPMPPPPRSDRPRRRRRSERPPRPGRGGADAPRGPRPCRGWRRGAAPGGETTRRGRRRSRGAPRPGRRGEPARPGPRPFDPQAVDEAAVGAREVDDLHPVLLRRERRVLPGDPRDREDEVVAGGAPQGALPRRQEPGALAVLDAAAQAVEGEGREG